MYELFKAILENNLPEVQRLILSGVDVNAEFLEPYHTGNHAHFLDIGRGVISLPPSQEITSGLTPLHEAVRLNHFEIAEFLLQNGANPTKAVEVHFFTMKSTSKPDEKRHLMWQNITPLHFCLDIRMADLLLRSSPSEEAFMAILQEPLYRRGTVCSPLERHHGNTRDKGKQALVKNLQTYLGCMLDPAVLEKRKEEILVAASERNLTDLVGFLLQACPFTPTMLGKALARAISDQAPDTPRLLLEKGANPNIRLDDIVTLSRVNFNYSAGYPNACLLAQYGAYAFGSEELEELFNSMVGDSLDTVISVGEGDPAAIKESLSLLMKLLDRTPDDAFFIQYPKPELLRLRQIYMQDERSRWVIPAGEEYNDNFHPPTPIKEPSVFLTIKSTMKRAYPHLKDWQDIQLAMIKVIFSAMDNLKLRLGGEDADEVRRRMAIIEHRREIESPESSALPSHISTILSNARQSMGHLEVTLMVFCFDSSSDARQDIITNDVRHTQIVEAATKQDGTFLGDGQLTLRLAHYYLNERNPLCNVAKARYLLDRAASIHHDIDARMAQGISLFLGTLYFEGGQDIAAGTAILNSLYEDIKPHIDEPASQKILTLLKELVSDKGLDIPELREGSSLASTL